MSETSRVVVTPVPAAVDAQIKIVHKEMQAICKVEGNALTHALACGEALNLAVESAGSEASHGLLTVWYKTRLPEYQGEVRALQNYRHLARNADAVKASGATSIAKALKFLSDEKAKSKGQAPSTRTPRKRVSVDKIDLSTALDALAVRLADLGTASLEERAAMVGRLIDMQRKIGEAVSGLMSPAKVA